LTEIRELPRYIPLASLPLSADGNEIGVSTSYCGVVAGPAQNWVLFEFVTFPTAWLRWKGYKPPRHLAHLLLMSDYGHR